MDPIGPLNLLNKIITIIFGVIIRSMLEGAFALLISAYALKLTLIKFHNILILILMVLTILSA